METGIFELALVFSIAAVLGVAAVVLRQPLVLAYLATGAVIGFFNIFHIADREIFSVFADLGIMFLLFLVGMEMNYTSLRKVGGVSLLVGLGQILFTAFFGFFIASSLGFVAIHAFYIAIALTFSSTIIIVKLLSDRKALQSLYGKISIGFLLVQDVVAILALIIVAGIGEHGSVNIPQLAASVFWGAALFVVMMVLGRTILPRIFDMIARSQELLFLLSLSWVFLVAAIVSTFGFSIEIAGFLAGIALANSSEHFQIAHRIKPLRDFFILVFFAILGASLVLYEISALWLPILVLSLFVLIGNPLIVMAIMGALGYRKKTSFLAGITVAQISEFSLILAVLGYRMGHIPDEVVGVISTVGVITITVSTYLITHGEKVFEFFSPILGIFERKNYKRDEAFGEQGSSIILIGHDRTGKSIASHLPKEETLLVDFNPDVIADLRSHGFRCVFGDASDPDIAETVDFSSVNLIISTAPMLEDNLSLLAVIRSLPQPPLVIVRAETEEDAKKLEREGADYIFIPLLYSGEHLGKAISRSRGDFTLLLSALKGGTM
ncbi:MAG: cation:proton antiporter [bacterium]|nr:cation:proton antiporter [bacterium]